MRKKNEMPRNWETLVRIEDTYFDIGIEHNKELKGWYIWVMLFEMQDGFRKYETYRGIVFTFRNSRFSRKKLEKAQDYLARHASEIAAAVHSEDKNKLDSLLTKIALLR